MSQITVYPRLYTSRRDIGGSVLVSKGDATVETLYGFLVNRSVNVGSWEFQKRVLEAALRLFGNFDEWLRDQRDNPRVVGFNADFITDTLNFIQTGERQMAVQNWLELVSEGDDTVHSVSPTKYLAARRSGSDQTTVRVLKDWCSQPNGLEDLLCSLNVFFGHSRHPRA